MKPPLPTPPPIKIEWRRPPGHIDGRTYLILGVALGAFLLLLVQAPL